MKEESERGLFYSVLMYTLSILCSKAWLLRRLIKWDKVKEEGGFNIWKLAREMGDWFCFQKWGAFFIFVKLRIFVCVLRYGKLGLRITLSME